MDGVVKDIKIAVPSKNLCLELPSIMNSIGSYRYVVTSKKKKKKKRCNNYTKVSKNTFLGMNIYEKH